MKQIIIVITLGILGLYNVERIKYDLLVYKSKYNEDKIIKFNGIIIRNKCYVKGVTGVTREGEYYNNKCINKDNIKYDKSIN